MQVQPIVASRPRAADVGILFEHHGLDAATSQRRRGRQPGRPSTHDHDGCFGHVTRAYTIESGARMDHDGLDEPRTLADWLARLLLEDTPGSPERLVLRAVVLLGLVAWTWMLARASIESNAVGMSFLHLIDLPFHEAGHIIFM